MINVLIVDDHPMLRKGIRSELSVTSDINVVDDASDGIEAVNKIRTLQPDIVLLDISMPQKSGFEGKD